MRVKSPRLAIVFSVLISFFLLSEASSAPLVQEPPEEAMIYQLLLNADKTSDPEVLLELAPDSPAVYFYIAEMSLSLSPVDISLSFKYLLKGLVLSLKDFWLFYNTIGAIGGSFAISLLGVALVVSIRRLIFSTPLYFHSVRERRYEGLFLILLPLGITGLYAAVSVLLFFGFFGAEKRQRRVFWLLMVLLFLSLLTTYSGIAYLKKGVDSEIKAIVGINTGRGISYPDTSLRDDNFYTLFSKALLYQYRGEYKRAIETYTSLLRETQDPRVYINLGNCYALTERYQQAESLYREALKRGRPVSAFYNLSIISREKLDFINADKYFMEAAKADLDRVNRLRRIQRQRGIPVLMNERLNTRELYGYLLKGLWRDAIPGSIILQVLTLIITSAAFVLHNRSKVLPQRCRKCGRVYCRTCEHRLHTGSICTTCYRTMVSFEMPSSERIQHLWRAYNFQRMRRSVLYIFSWIIPPIALIDRYPLKGLILSWLFIFSLSLTGLCLLFRVNLVSASLTPMVYAAGLFAFIIYVYTWRMSMKKLKRGAL